MSSKDDYVKMYEPFWGSWQLESQLGQDTLGTVYKIYKNDWDNKHESILRLISVTPTFPNTLEKISTKDNSNNSLIDSINNKLQKLSALKEDTNILSYKDHKIVKRDDNSGYDVLVRMEYLNTLSSFLNTNELSVHDVIILGINICSALEICSKNNIFHKNINEDNIFLGVDGKFKLGNFDFSFKNITSLDEDVFNISHLYLAPEIFNLEKYDIRSDLYSLGIVLYRLLNQGHFPFSPTFSNEISSKSLKFCTSQRLSNKAIPYPVCANRALGDIILKSIAFNREERYQSPTEMKNILKELLCSLDTSELDTFVPLTYYNISSLLNSNKEQEPVISQGNNVNGNLVEYIGNDTYLINLSDGHKIYKVNDDKSIFIKLCNDTAYNIKYYKDWIYFINSSDNDKIYKISTSGSCKKMVIDDEVTSMLFHQNWIYYTSYNKNIFRIKPDGLDKMRINSDKSCYLNIYNNYLYYSNTSDNGSIYKININNNHKKKLNNFNSAFLNIYQDSIFYVNKDDCSKIYKINPDGTENTLISKYSAEFINVYKNHIYFSSVENGHSLYKINIDGSNPIKLNDEYSQQINIINDWVYYCNSNDKGSLYKMKLDGSLKTKINALIDHNYLFF